MVKLLAVLVLCSGDVLVAYNSISCRPLRALSSGNYLATFQIG